MSRLPLQAYRHYIGRLGAEEPRLPGLQNLTNDQIFFLSYAHVSFLWLFLAFPMMHIRRFSSGADTRNRLLRCSKR